ncbi:MAG: aspartyl protease family protein [Deltaproteobacteria bacterium]|nr:aspartyl protease family protein [Deltaproteobacteria bacterium]
MRVNGEWLLCDDGIERPVIRGEVATRDRLWLAAEFLVDTGADRTVLTADVFSALAFPPTPAHERIQGVGGLVDNANATEDAIDPLGLPWHLSPSTPSADGAPSSARLWTTRCLSGTRRAASGT